jgi:hypothetical protein
MMDDKVAPTPADVAQGGLVAQLRDIASAVKEGLVTTEEGERMRQRIINGPPSSHQDHDKEDLAKYFREAELRTHQVWRREFEKFTTIKETWMKTSLETKRAMFVDKAKARNLNPTEAMLSIYLLYGGEAELEFLRSLLVSSSGSLRLMMHNMYVASACDASFLHSFGDKIMKLSEPLFPHVSDFTAMNTMLIEEVDNGGAPERSRFFKNPDDNDPLGGGPTHFYLQTDSDGQYYTDMTTVEQTVAGLQRQLGSVQSALAKVKPTTSQSQGSGKQWYGKNKGKNYNNSSFPYNNNSTSPNTNYNSNTNNFPYNAQGYQNQGYQPNQQYSQTPFPHNPAPSYTGRGNTTGAGEPPQQAPPTQTTRKA